MPAIGTAFGSPAASVADGLKRVTSKTFIQIQILFHFFSTNPVVQVIVKSAGIYVTFNEKKPFSQNLNLEYNHMKHALKMNFPISFSGNGTCDWFKMETS